MLFHSSLRKELSRNFGATLIVLVTIVMTMMLIRTLGLASSGQVNPAEISMVLGYTMLGHLTTIISMSLFIASVGTLSRMYLDSEMVIWHVGGKGLLSLLKPMMRFAWPALIVIALLLLIVWPWSNRQITELKNRYEHRSDLERVSPGQFQESANGMSVFFIDKSRESSSDGKNVFISSSENNRRAMTTAKTGHIEVRDQKRYLVLFNGQRVEQVNNEDDIKVTAFKSYETETDKEDKTTAVPPPSAIDTLELIKFPTKLNLGELTWRIGLTLAAFNLVLISVAVTSANPRVGRGGNFALALFIFIVYYNLINLSQSWVTTGKSDIFTMLTTVHGGVFLAFVAWSAIRHNNWSWRNLIPMKATK
jgi:lipopolysaccharide export system permease protein